mgnify:CR=1 FL=1
MERIGDFMLSKNDFIDSALKGNGVQNDERDVWVNVDGEQYTVSIDGVLDHEETEPFEASSYLENNLDADVWDNLYDQYVADYCKKNGR